MNSVSFSPLRQARVMQGGAVSSATLFKSIAFSAASVNKPPRRKVLTDAGLCLRALKLAVKSVLSFSTSPWRSASQGLDRVSKG